VIDTAVKWATLGICAGVWVTLVYLVARGWCSQVYGRRSQGWWWTRLIWRTGQT